MSLNLKRHAPKKVASTDKGRSGSAPLAEPLEQRTMLTNVVVNTIIDKYTDPRTGYMSLRTAVDIARGSDDAGTVTFDPVVFATPRKITLTDEINLSGSAFGLYITGPAAGVTISAAHRSRVFRIQGPNVNISHLTISDGFAVGGGIINQGPIWNCTLTDVTFSGNSSLPTYPAGGGAIYNTGKMTLKNVTIESNAAPNGSGGGIYQGGVMELVNVTIANNSASDDGGGLAISSDPGVTTTMRNVTISGNTARRSGGGLAAAATPSATTITNTIVVGNRLTGTEGRGPDLSGSFISGGGNLIGIADGATGSGALDQTGTVAAPLDGMLGELSNNGSSTRTMEPRPGSPAIDHGVKDDAASPTDQRYRPRVSNSVIDSGAVEVQPASVVKRQVFYNNSVFDGNDPGSNSSDDAAIPIDKLSSVGGDAFFNVTSYVKGLNGIMIDIADLPEGMTPTAEDFAIRHRFLGPMPRNFFPGPAPLSVSVRRGEGSDGSDRVTLIWRDHTGFETPGRPEALVNGWLEVTPIANARTGLSSSAYFNFGNLIGETGNSTQGESLLRVNAIDIAAVKEGMNRRSTIDSMLDFDRNGRVNALDLAAAKRNLNGSLGVRLPVAGAPGPSPTSLTALATRTDSDRPVKLWDKTTIQ
jgi:predicted outer membrane repeat protein